MTAGQTEKLKALAPCPFCGSHAQTDFIEGESYIIECYACEARTGCKDSAEAAIEAWNRRAEKEAPDSHVIPPPAPDLGYYRMPMQALGQHQEKP